MKSQFSLKRLAGIIATIGIRSAAGYCRNNGLSFHTAYFLIFGRNPRKL